jgi:hypothetical protein
MPLVMDLASLKTDVARDSLVAAFPPTIDVTSASGVSNVTGSVADPDPGYGAFLTHGSGMGRKSASGSGIRDEQPGSYFLELRNHFLGFFWG